MLFWIKQGDTLPYLETVLLDDQHRPVDLTLAGTVAFRMADVDTNAMSIDSNAIVLSPATDGKVSYQWAAGDTDIDGLYNGSFIVTFGDGRVQTFPTDGFINVIVGSAVGVRAGIENWLIYQLREMTAELGETDYPDYTFTDKLADRNGELEAAAYDIWLLKAAKYADMVDVTENASSRSLSQLQAHALEMARMYKSMSAILSATTPLPRVAPQQNARIRNITRY